MTLFLRLWLTLALTLGFAAATSTLEALPASALTNCHNQSFQDGSRQGGMAWCDSSGGSATAIAVLVRCSASSTWHIGPRRYLPYSVSLWYCPSGQTVTGTGIQFYV